MTSQAPESPPLMSGKDIQLFKGGQLHKLYEKLGAHPGKLGNHDGVYFAVWAPNAERVSVIGDFNGWQVEANPLSAQTSSGIWEGFVPGVGAGAVYKFKIVSRHNGHGVDKADPVGFQHEVAPRTASVVQDLAYEWGDADWIQARGAHNSLSSPISVYEVHLGLGRGILETGIDPCRIWRWPTALCPT